GSAPGQLTINDLLQAWQ
ncbi:MAG: hypothetical protein ACTILS_08885, partial [Leuconostoc mesenteroides]